MIVNYALIDGWFNYLIKIDKEKKSKNTDIKDIFKILKNKLYNIKMIIVNNKLIKN
jgi:hypothetical protein